MPLSGITFDDGAAVNDELDFVVADEPKSVAEKVGPEEVAIVIYHSVKFSREGVGVV